MTKELKFSDCTLLKLEKQFHIKLLDEHPALNDWLQGTADLSDWEKTNVLFFQKILMRHVHSWNEIELIQNFIGPVFTLVNFFTEKFNYFAERHFEGIVDEVKMWGNPDGMLASGFREPEKPFFFFQEYKRHLDPKGDPAGQCLADAMSPAYSATSDQIFDIFRILKVLKQIIIELVN
ncbi:MAG: hypothetical protein B6242_15470 [Anaerolineaceae bacterium 4572_78]|nr:MAG: hypothetical protein B6242_15470 [Anaerolineaceae bacterium 4572_78]